jgi:retron-type reverse transcriptase
MKRHGNLFNKIVEIENLKLAYKKAKKGKSTKSFVVRFDKNAEARLLDIQNILLTNYFKTSNYHTKWVHEPKRRLIYVLPFSPDRIVQHAIMNIVEPIWDNLLISDSYACRTGKGLHAGSKRCMEFVRKFKYCLKCDIAKFYPSINQDILFNIIQRKIKCKPTLNLLEEIIYSIPGGKNVPIGNYTSQWFGNLYLNELDQHLKHQHKVKQYIRYCDDFVLFDNSKQFLNDMASAIKTFCNEELELSLSKCDLFPINQGVDFLGYRHFPDYILLRKSTSKRVKKRLRILPKLLESGKVTLEHFRSSIASTKGWLRWANTYNFSISLQLKEMDYIVGA